MQLLINANALHIPLRDNSIQAVVTSPPYWALRDYGTATWVGGDPGCDHISFKKKDLSSGLRNDGRKHQGLYEGEKATEIIELYRDTCGKCGAIRKDGQLGLEPLHDCQGWATGAPCGECYVCHMVAVFREVKRVLRDDGVLFLNLGDSFFASPAGKPSQKYVVDETAGDGIFARRYRNNHAGGIDKDKDARRTTGAKIPGLKPKDMVGIPWRVAFALQADGWWLRSDVIWSKPNPMPESVTDRPAKTHEYVFVLTKSARYYWDADAVREALQESSIERANYGWHGNMVYDENGKETYRSQPDHTGKMGERWFPPAGHNLRTVWQIATQPYSGAHYATYPEALVERCLKAATKPDSTVLDPFAGSGTTLLVAKRMGLRAVGIDLSYKYLRENAWQRVGMDQRALL